ncbi:MAG: saccharopine dehydrogenase NADP-binding domain-containing protein, partial [Pseudomonadota bacterium]
MNVLILGGYGVFGGRLARLLVEDGHTVTVAGRNGQKARGFATEIGANPLQLDSTDADALAAALNTTEVVIDAAGPFQGYDDDPYRVPRAAIAKGRHYLDLSDDAGFTSGISTLHGDAEAKGVTVLSGLSSVPAFSAAAARSGSNGLTEIALIESAILPGNRAPRGMSVMRAILSQAGNPLPLWRGGQWRDTHAWTKSKHIHLSVPPSWEKYPGGSGGLGPPASRRLKGGANLAPITRPAAFIGAPDLTLFPQHFNARSVLFRAGLELRLMHHGLAAFALIRRFRLLPRLDRFATPLHRVASWLEGGG